VNVETEEAMTYGVFILQPDRRSWKLVETYLNRGDAERERAYLSDMLGLTAIVFVSTATA
jgi:hypothetical protein